MNIDTVVIQPTPFCNLDCSYCYLPDRLNTKRIQGETLEQIFKLILSSRFVSDKINIMWHAGEPLTLPLSFYEQAFDLQKRCNTQGIRIINSFQTNGTLITQAWCDFFKDYNVRIGISLDGPEHIHNANRVDRSGRGSFQKAMKGIKLLRTNGIDYGIIAVVTKESVQHPDEIWQFFMKLRPTRLGFNPEEVGGANRRFSLQTDEWVERYRAFFDRIVALSMQSTEPIIVREIENLLGNLISDRPPKRFVTNEPMRYLNFDYNGYISTFAPELLSVDKHTYGDFTFGHVSEGTLEGILNHPNFLTAYAQIERGVEMCQQTCDYFMFCGGGCPSNKLFENGTFTSTATRACQLHIKIPVDVLLKRLENIYQIKPI